MILKFKNDKERIAFLEDYRNRSNGWYIWKQDDELNRMWWRFDLSKSALVVEEQLQTFTWPDTHMTWRPIHWYIIKDWDVPFADGVATKTLALAELKKEAAERHD